MKAICPSLPSAKILHKLSPQTKTVNIITEDLLRKVLNIIACFKKEIGAIPEVKKISYFPKGTLLTFWTFTDNNNQKVLRKIYKIEQKIRDQFPDILFDFTVIFNPKEDAPVNFVTDFLN